MSLEYKQRLEPKVDNTVNEVTFREIWIDALPKRTSVSMTNKTFYERSRQFVQIYLKAKIRGIEGGAGTLNELSFS